MSRTVVFHNPKAGESGHWPGMLLSLLEEQGFSSQYVSVKSENWQDFEKSTRFLTVAGGDGTIRAVVGALLQRTLMQRQYPLAIVPLGTANNISKALGIPQDPEEAINAIGKALPRKIDVGFVEGLEDTDFFIEAVGIGAFPALVKKMKDRDSEESESVEERLNDALKALEEVVEDFESIPATVTIDGTRYEGEFLMIEIMNIQSVGPNLVLAEGTDPGDGLMEVVMIPADHRNKLLRHIRSSIRGKKSSFSYIRVKTNELRLVIPKARLHIDDQLIKYAGGELTLYLKQGVLEILAPEG